MPLFTPDVFYPHITDIPGRFFKERGLKLAVLDVDNTLTSHNNPTPFPGVAEWIAAREAEGVILCILSNNSPGRVEPFARKLRLPFVANAAKPLPWGLAKACKRYGVERRACCLIGDQLFTDMLAANLFPGGTSVLVEPWEEETHGFLAVKRKWEKPFLRRYFRKRGEKGG